MISLVTLTIIHFRKGCFHLLSFTVLHIPIGQGSSTLLATLIALLQATFCSALTVHPFSILPAPGARVSLEAAALIRAPEWKWTGVVCH